MRAREYANAFLVVTAFGMVALIGYLTGIATIEKYGPQSWLEKWQTLVAGALAIGAALITVAAMFWQDISQQKRHDQLILVGFRAEALVVDRAAYLSNAIRATADEVDKFFKEHIQRPFKELPSAEVLKEFLDMEVHLKQVVDRKAIQDCARLFGPRMIHVYEMLDAKSEAVRVCNDEVHRLGKKGATPGIVSEINKVFEDLDEVCVGLGDRIREFADCLDELKGTYAIRRQY